MMAHQTGAHSRAHFGPPDLYAIVSKKAESKLWCELLFKALQRGLGCKKLNQRPPRRGRMVEHTYGLKISVLL